MNVTPLRLVAATNNAHKLEEFRRMLQPLGYKVQSLADIGLEIDPEETGDTFAENARIKAVAVCKASGLPAIADDSGVCVDALNGAPGVHTARYAGVDGEGRDKANNQKLLREMEHVEDRLRTARFVSAIVLAMPSGRELVTEGVCEGVIGREERGENGFGYDPLFYVGDRSFAEFSNKEKDGCSHRANALVQFVQRLPEFIRSENNRA